MWEMVFTLFMLLLLQTVLGFDNLLYISLESKKAPADKQRYVEKLGIGIAILLRIALLFFLVNVIDSFQDPLLKFGLIEYFEGSFNLHSIIVLAGGIFIIHTSVKEIWHMISLKESGEIELKPAKPATVANVTVMIVIMNLVFSFDSILAAMALTKDMWLMTASIVISGILMVWLSGKVSIFLAKNRMFEVLGLFILMLVGVMLLTEGGHLAHIKLFGNEIVPMSKTTFYFVIVILIVVDLAQTRYKKKLKIESAQSSKS